MICPVILVTFEEVKWKPVSENIFTSPLGQCPEIFSDHYHAVDGRVNRDGFEV
jgi:hypothetical protein